MPQFTFDAIGTRIEQDAIEAHIDLAKYGSGVKFLDTPVKPGTRIAHGRTPTVRSSSQPEPTSSKGSEQNPPDARYIYCTPDVLEATLGKANLAAMTNGRLTSPDPDAFRRRMVSVEQRSNALKVELEQIRVQFYPDYHIADIDDGPPAYAEAVGKCVAKYFPPLMTTAKLLTDLEQYLRKLFFLIKGCAGASDRREMHHRVEYFSYWIDWLRIEEAQEPPPLDRQTPHGVQSYLKALRRIVEAWSKAHPTAIVATGTPIRDQRETDSASQMGNAGKLQPSIDTNLKTVSTIKIGAPEKAGTENYDHSPTSNGQNTWKPVSRNDPQLTDLTPAEFGALRKKMEYFGRQHPKSCAKQKGRGKRMLNVYLAQEIYKAARELRQKRKN